MAVTADPRRAVRPAAPEDWPQVAALRQAAFSRRGDPDTLLDGMWVLVEDGSVRGCARLEVEGQWFGGRVVPTGIVSSVAVAPEGRGRGLGRHLIHSVAHEARAIGLARLALYPSAIEPYRRTGFEIAGVHLTLSLGAADLPRASDPAVAAMSEEDLPAVTACYDRLAASSEGAIARSERWWRSRVLSPIPPTPGDDSEVYAYVVGDGSTVNGFLVHTQHANGDGYESRIICRDLAWESERSARALLGLVAGGRPHVTGIEWSGRLVDPVELVVDAKPIVVESSPWMARLLDAAAALEAQGYPGVARADIALRVQDPLEPGWSCGLRLRIEDGVATVEAAPEAAAAVDVGALAAILAGGLDPATAVRLGRLEPAGLDLETFAPLVPAGPRWIGDRF
jgi:predicted acetyltransferase